MLKTLALLALVALMASLLCEVTVAMPAHDKPEVALGEEEALQSTPASQTLLRHEPLRRQNKQPDAVAVVPAATASNICYPTLASHISGKTGTCMRTNLCKGTTYVGLCSGPNSVTCCVPNPGLPAAPPPPGPRARVYPEIHGLSVDIAVPLTMTAARCLFAQGMQTVIVRGFRSTGKVDANMCGSLKTAWTTFGAVSKFDVYFFPCPKCAADGPTQLRNLVSTIASDDACNAAFSGRVWLDIEMARPYWSTSTAANKAWYQKLVDACGTYNVDCGIYSSWPQWEEIFGSRTYSYNPQFPLWFAHYDGRKTFTDFVPFGGWKQPFIKQYLGDKTLCGIPVDYNWQV